MPLTPRWSQVNGNKPASLHPTNLESPAPKQHVDFRPISLTLVLIRVMDGAIGRTKVSVPCTAVASTYNITLYRIFLTWPK